MLVSWDKSRVLSLNSEKFSLFFFNGKTVQMKKFVTFSKLQHKLPRDDERDTLFKERDDTPRAHHTLSLSLSLSLSVRARKTHLLWTKERNFKRKEREREGKERESFCVPFSFRRERKRERISILKSRDFLPFVLTLSLLIRACITSAKAATRAFPGNAFVCL